MILLTNINVPLDTDFENLSIIAAKQLGINKSDIISCELYRKSVDARKKDNVHFCISLVVAVKSGEERLIKKIKTT